MHGDSSLYKIESNLKEILPTQVEPPLEIYHYGKQILLQDQNKSMSLKVCLISQLEI